MAYGAQVVKRFLHPAGIPLEKREAVTQVLLLRADAIREGPGGGSFSRAGFASLSTERNCPDHRPER
jgi:hypothetical protein